MRYRYLVRPGDWHIWEVDPSNGCQRSYSTRNVTNQDGERDPAAPNFTYENLAEKYGFFPIEKQEI